MVPVKTNTSDRFKPQHSGLGKKLLAKCEDIALRNNYNQLCVTSGEGVIRYYEKRGFHHVEDTYMGTTYHYMIKNIYTIPPIVEKIFLTYAIV